MFKLSKFFYLVLLILLKVVNCQDSVKKFEFDRNLVGVTFQPYVRDPEVDWANYTLEEVKNLLRNISEKFTLISTYGVGAIPRNSTRLEHLLNSGRINLTEEEWDKVDANCHIAKGAAEINLENNSTRLKVAQAIWKHDDSEFQNIEIKNAIKASKVANGLWPGIRTVWGLIFTTNFLNEERAFNLVNIILKYKKQVQELKLKIGTRFHSCHDIKNIDPNILKNKFKPLINELDFIFCSYFPEYSLFPINRDISFIVQDMWNKFENGKKYLKSINPQIEVIFGETGWPSEGRDGTLDNKTFNVKNLFEYWKQLKQKSRDENQSLYLFEAFDEPWKSGPDGRERHFGWWKFLENNQIIEKIQELDAIESPTDPVLDLDLFFLIVFIFSIFGVGLLVYIVWNRNTFMKLNKFLRRKENIELFENIDRILRENYKGLVIRKKDFDDVTHLASGNYGRVLRATYKGKDVILKSTKDFKNELQSEILSKELRIMSKLKTHPYVGKFIGACFETIEDRHVHIVVEFCDFGNLEIYLKQNKKNFKNIFDNKFRNYDGLMNTHDLIKWAAQIASGMHFLGNSDVIHGDLAARNVLLHSKECVKITDFGLSKKLYHYNDGGIYQQIHDKPLPMAWLAEETLFQKIFSTKTDIWAFGVTLWEIFSLGERPYGDLTQNISNEEFKKRIKEGERLTEPDFSNTEIFEEMKKCWNKQPEARPTFTHFENFFLEISSI